MQPNDILVHVASSLPCGVVRLDRFTTKRKSFFFVKTMLSSELSLKSRIRCFRDSGAVFCFFGIECFSSLLFE